MIEILLGEGATTMGADGARMLMSQTPFPKALLSHLPPLHQTGAHEGECKALSPMART